MNMFRSALIGLALTFSCGAMVHAGDVQTPFGTCLAVHGTVEFTTISEETIDGSLAGDLEGTFSFAVTEVVEFAPGITLFHYEGTIITASGDLSVTGSLIAIEAGMLTIVASGMSVTGGTGDFENATGRMGMLGFQLPDPPPSFMRYGGLICVP